MSVVKSTGETEEVPTVVDKTSQDVKKKLNTLSGRFTGFEDQLNLTRQKKKDDDEKKIIALQTQIDNLKASLATESKNRADSVKALQAWLADKITQFTDEVKIPLTEKIQKLHLRIDGVDERMTNLEDEHKQDRENFPKLIDARCDELLREIRDMKVAFENSEKAREEKEVRILTKLRNQGIKLNQQFVSEKELNDQKLAAIRQDIIDEVSQRAKGYEVIKKQIEDEVLALKESIHKEEQVRSQTDEDLVQAINHYAAALQDGIKIVSAQ